MSITHTTIDGITVHSPIEHEDGAELWWLCSTQVSPHADINAGWPRFEKAATAAVKKWLITSPGWKRHIKYHRLRYFRTLGETCYHGVWNIQVILSRRAPAS